MQFSDVLVMMIILNDNDIDADDDNSPYRISAKSSQNALRHQHLGFFAVMQTSGRVHVTSLFYTRVSTLHFAVMDDRKSFRTPW